MGANIPYSKQEDDIIIEMHGKGFKPDAICEVLKTRTRNQIKERGYSLGLKWTPEPTIDLDAYAKIMKGGVICR